MLTPTVPLRQSIAAAPATSAHDGMRAAPARIAARLRMASAFVRQRIGGLTGPRARAIGANVAALLSGRASSPCWNQWAAPASSAETTTRAFSTLTTSSRAKRTAPRTGSTRRTSAGACGKRNATTCKSSARTATASRRTRKPGAPTRSSAAEPRYFDIACRRIEEAWKQPRLFEEPKPKPVQEALL